jgi:hypothetical protein
MRPKPVPRWAVMLLLAGFVLLPIAVLVIWAMGALLGTMGDDIGGAVLVRIALAGGIFWTIDLLGLVLALALNSLGDDDS